MSGAERHPEPSEAGPRGPGVSEGNGAEGAGGGAERAAEWVYRGVWKGVSGLFKVPPTPPELPSLPGDTSRSFHPSRSFLRYLQLWFWIGALAIDFIILVGWMGIFFANREAGLILAVPALLLAILPDIVAYVAVHLKYDTMWYVMNRRSLRCRRGIWTIMEHTITFENVQNVHIRRGPVQYLFGIWTIVIETAGATEPEGSSHWAVGNKAIMEGIDRPEEIRELIMERVRRSRGTGIGERPEEEAPSRPMWGPAHLQMLTEIREGIEAIGAAPGEI